MAKLNGFRAGWNAAQIRTYIDGQVVEMEKSIFQTLQYFGEQFVNKARNTKTYRDRTGNLRASIGYVIIKDGEIVDDNFASSSKGSDRNSGVLAAKNFIDDLIGDYPRGYVLIGVAGMSYAAYVEAKGFDVITGSAPTDKEIQNLFDEIKL